MKKQNYATLIIFALIFLGVSAFIIVINNNIMKEIETAERQLSQSPAIQVVKKVKQETRKDLKAALARDDVETRKENVARQQVKQEIKSTNLKPIYEMPLSDPNLPL